MREKLNGCLLSLLILIVSFFCLVYFYVGIPFEDPRYGKVEKIHNLTIDDAKQCGSFICKYEADSCIYKGYDISVDFAFAEHLHELNRNKRDSIYIYDNKCTVLVSIKNHEELSRNGYNDSWIIDSQMGCIKDGTLFYYYDAPEPPDTIICYIRESDSSIRDAKYITLNDLENVIKWDTVQTLRLYRINY